MRPYITVIRDSFHEAFASRVLWILLGVSTLVLAALAPLGLKDERATELHPRSVSDWPALIARFHDASNDAQPSPAKRIWELAGDAFHDTINESMESGDQPDVTRERVATLLDEINAMLENPELYDQTAWSDVELSEAVKTSIDHGVANLEPEQVVDLNRQLLKSAFPVEIANAPDKELHLSYFGNSVSGPLPITRDMAEPIIELILAGAMDVLVGVVAVFVAILVTAPIIPHTFEAGAIDLLLSKPIARSLLFLTKFFGGCAFILLNAGYFLVGLWIIMGTRFGIWNNGLLWCLPVFLFLFVVYYSVSAAAAVRWKNPTVSIVVTIIFWAACFAVGAAKNVIENVFLSPDRIVTLLPGDDSLLAVTQSANIVEWQTDEWEEILKPADGGRRFGPSRTLVGPVLSTDREQLVYVPRARRRRRFSFLPPEVNVTTATWTDGSWQQESGAAVPTGTSWLFRDPQGDIIVAATSGMFRFHADATGGGSELSIAGIRLPFGGGGGEEPFENVGPDEPLGLTEPFAATMHPESGDLAVYHKGTLRLLSLSESREYSVGISRDFENFDGMATLAYAGDTVVCALDDGRLEVIDAGSLETRTTLQPAGKSEPYTVTADNTGKHFAAVFHDGTLVLFDDTGNGARQIDNDVSTATFNDDGTALLVADRFTRVTKYDLESFSIQEQFEPDPDVLTIVNRYVIRPLYTVFPKPGELGNVVNYVLTDRETVVAGPPVETDLRQTRQALDIAGPVWSSLAFVVVLLLTTCVGISRMDI